jgi:hypothetical protein
LIDLGILCCGDILTCIDASIAQNSLLERANSSRNLLGILQPDDSLARMSYACMFDIGDVIVQALVSCF